MIFLRDAFLIIVGFIALVKGADIFVEGSSALAKNCKVPAMIIGLTIVAMGTSAPELAVSTTAALKGSNEIAVSNVIGSNIFNLMVVLGVCAIISEVPVDKVILKRDFPVSIIAAILAAILSCGSKIFGGGLFKGTALSEVGMVKRYIGIILLVIFTGYILYLIYDAKRHPVEIEEVSDLSTGKCFLYIVIGAVVLIIGGKIVVFSSTDLARLLGMSETLIGLTVVALGTSLPELVTSIVAARAKETELAIGNAIGSNIFNMLLILGVSSTIHPVAVNLASLYDIFILVLFTVLIMLFIIKDKGLKRMEGLIMVLLYVCYVVYAAMR